MTKKQALRYIERMAKRDGFCFGNEEVAALLIARDVLRELVKKTEPPKEKP